MNHISTTTFLLSYLQYRPVFLSLIRAKEAAMYQPFLPMKHPILDVGCGDGFFAQTAFGRTLDSRNRKSFDSGNLREVIDVGLDVEDSRMGEAQKLDVYKNVVVYDGKHFPFRNNTFSTIVSNCVLEHVPALDQVLKEMHRVLKPGGRALVTVMAKPWEEHLFGAMLLGNSYRNYMRRKQIHLNIFSYTEWQKVFEKAGFIIEKAEGYLSPTACRLIDVCHYLSIPSLITYKLFGKWVLWPRLASSYPISWFAKILDEKIEPDKSGAIFFVLKK